MQRDPLNTLQRQPDWNDWMPLDWFEEKPASFRLYLRCQGAPFLPQLTSQTDLIHLTQYRHKLEQTLSQCFENEHLPTLPALWEILTWEQGYLFLSCPELRNWWHQLSTTQLTTHPLTSFQSLLNQLTQQAFNTWRWLNHQLDDFAQRWHWSLQPPLISTLRNAQTPYQQAIIDLRTRGIHLPTQASNACCDFEFAGCWLRLRAIPIPATPSSTDSLAEWRLVIILESQPNHTLPQGITLQVSDEQNLLDEQHLQDSQVAYLYSSVVGEYREQFFVTIRLASGLALTLPPFTYSVN